MTNNLSMLAAMTGALLASGGQGRHAGRIRPKPAKRKAENSTKRKHGFKAKKKGRSR